MKALSIRAPWWWFILHGGKDIENRDWSTAYRGPVLIHASAWWRADEITGDWDAALVMGRASGRWQPGAGVSFLTFAADLKTAGGCLIGIATLADSVTRHPSPWFVGRYGFVLVDARPLAQPIPCKGALGLFDVPDNLLPPEAR